MFASSMDQRVFRWFGHVIGCPNQSITQRLDDYRMARRVLRAEESGGRVRGRPRLGWMDPWCDGLGLVLMVLLWNLEGYQIYSNLFPSGHYLI